MDEPSQNLKSLEGHAWRNEIIRDPFVLNYQVNTGFLDETKRPRRADSGIEVLTAIARQTTFGAIFASWALEIQMIAKVRVDDFVLHWQALCRNGKFEKAFKDLALCMAKVHSYATYLSL